MAIQYETNKMTVMMSNDSVIDECYEVATTAMGSANEEWKNIWTHVYRDKFDLYVVLARDDAASDKLVGMFCFGRCCRRAEDDSRLFGKKVERVPLCFNHRFLEMSIVFQKMYFC